LLDEGERKVKEVIELALQRASRKGLSQSDTAELIIDFLDIHNLKPSGSSIVHVQSSSIQQPVQPVSKNIIEPPPFPIESVLTGKQEVVLWDQQDLLDSLSGVSWSFSCRPEGWDTDLEFVGTPAMKGSIGVVIEFRALLLQGDPMNLFPVFVGLDAGKVDPDKIKEEARVQAMHMLKRRNSKVTANTIPLTAFPSEMSVISGRVGGGFGADALDATQLQWEKSNIRQMIV